MEAPKGDTNIVPIWIQDEWTTTERAVREAAQAAGTDSSIVFVLLSKRDSDTLRDSLAAFNAAKEVLGTRQNPTTPEGFEARRAMDSRMVIERKKLDTLINSIIEKGRVYQGGGFEIIEPTFAASVKTALDASLARLFPKFNIGDHKDWGKVVEKAQDGAVDALKTVGYNGNANQHPVCQEILNFISGAGKKGNEIRKKFTGAGYGWPQDAVDGALLVLLSNDYLTASQNGQAKTFKQVNQSNIGVTDFRLQGVTISTGQRIALRGLLTDMKIPYKPGDEADSILAALQLLLDLANDAGGDSPLPERPSKVKIEDLRSLTGNEQFAAIVEAKTELLNDFNTWSGLKEKKTQRLDRWNSLLRLKQHASNLPVAGLVAPQILAIQTSRSLLADPDPVTPLINQLIEVLRANLQGAYQRFQESYQEQLKKLDQTEAWQQINDSQRQTILIQANLLETTTPKVGTENDLLTALDTQSLSAWENLIAALPARSSQAIMQAIKLLEPEAVKIIPKSITLRTLDEADTYLSDLRSEIKKHLDNGKPVVL